VSMEKLKGNLVDKKNMKLTLKLIVNGEKNVHDVMDSYADCVEDLRRPRSHLNI